ncbi:hypothetical protein BZM26_32685 [Paraburkholderia strydomiana]|nr:hypothetical protein BZM26_32685 [Paraburkholderia strydomiana]
MEGHLLWMAKRWFAAAIQWLVKERVDTRKREGRQLSRCWIDALMSDWICQTAAIHSERQ